MQTQRELTPEEKIVGAIFRQATEDLTSSHAVVRLLAQYFIRSASYRYLADLAGLNASYLIRQTMAIAKSKAVKNVPAKHEKQGQAKSCPLGL